MRIDSHQHFWVYNPTDYVWMSDRMDALRQDFLPQHLEPLLADIEFEGSVAVQARRLETETDWLLSLADKYPFIQGVVGWVDFTSPRLDESLERFATHPKLRGFRELVHDMPDPEYAVSAEHVRAVSKLARYGFTYDLLLKPQHIRPALQLARRFPDQLFVVDHIAKPYIKSGQIESWSTDISELGRCENVYCKLSGMVTEAEWNHWSHDIFRPYVDVVLEAFGPSRLMIGSDWPVCTLSGSYSATMGIVFNLTNTQSAFERDAILGGNASHFYRLAGMATQTAGIAL